MTHGVLNFLKPPGMTSHDAVAFVRRVLGEKRVGHTGTLDPAAAGTLPICVGLATRLVEELQAGTKTYIAEATFGRETDSGDLLGETVRQCDASHLDLQTLRGALDWFRGEIEQTPPMHSAVKVGGQKLYDLARRGEEVEIPTRCVTISRLHVSRWMPGAAPRAMLRIECSGGTYIRSLVRDIGRSLGLAATMSFLLRSRSGFFGLNEAVSPQEFAAKPELLSLREVLDWLSLWQVQDDERALALWQGKRVDGIVVPTQHERVKLEYASARQENRPISREHLFKSKGPVLVENEAQTLFALTSHDADGLWKADKVFDLRT